MDKKPKQKLFAVLRSVDYEGEGLVGIYSTKANAIEAAKQHISTPYWGDDVRIYEMFVDDRPQQVVNPVWTWNVDGRV